eukprot:g3727.t1
MATFSTAGRFGGRVDPRKRGRGPARKLSKADEKKVRSKLRAAAYTAGGIDWHRLFRHYDRDNSGDIGFVEFKRLLRSDAKIPVSQLPDVDVRALYNMIDTDGSGDIEADEFIAWVEGDVNTDGSGITADSGSYGSSPRRHRKRSSGYGKVSPTELSSPSQRRFHFEQGTWLYNNDEHSDAEGAAMRRHDSPKNSMNKTFEQSETEMESEDIQQSAQRAINAAERSLSRKHLEIASKNSPRLVYDDAQAHSQLSSPFMSTNSSQLESINSEASFDALLALQRDKDNLTQELERIKASAQTSHSETEALHRVVRQQESELKGFHQDIDAREALIKSQSEQLKALKILVEAHAAELPGGVSISTGAHVHSPTLEKGAAGVHATDSKTVSHGTPVAATDVDLKEDLVAQLQSQMSRMDQDVDTTPLNIESSPPSSQRMGQSELSKSPYEVTTTPWQPGSVTRSSSSGPQDEQTSSLAEKHLVNLQGKHSKLQAAYDIAARQANDLGKEKIELEHKLRNLSYTATETEEALKQTLRLKDAEIAKLHEELSEELRCHLKVQRDMMAELAQYQQEQARLISRAESSEARAEVLTQQLGSERRDKMTSSQAMSSMDARFKAIHEENLRLAAQLSDSEQKHKAAANRAAMLQRAVEDMQKDHRRVLEENLAATKSLKAALVSAEQGRDLAEAQLAALSRNSDKGSDSNTDIKMAASSEVPSLAREESVPELKAVVKMLHSENSALELQLDEVQSKLDALKAKHEGHEDHDEYSVLLDEDLGEFVDD